MNKLDKKNEMFVLEAKKIFDDAKTYSEYELIGHLRLVKTLCKKNNKILDRRLKIATLQHILNGLSKRQIAILKWKCWDGYTRVVIGKLLGITHERVRQIENDALERFEFLIQAKESAEVNPTIELLCLNSRGYLGLKRSGINTIEQLVQLSRKDILEIKGIGLDSAQNIMQKLNEYMTRVAPSNKSFMERLPIDTLHLSNRSTNALKSNGVIIIRQLVELSVDDIYRMRGIGVKCRNEILKRKQEVMSQYKQSKAHN